MKSIYKSAQAKEEVLALYDQKQESLGFAVTERDVNTSYGRTRVLICGNPNGKKMVVFHGVHAGSPLTLSCLQGLIDDYQLYAIDTIGQATRSAETTINIKDESFAIWADEVLDELAITTTDFIGVSYGAYILQKLITHRPTKVGKCVFLVPSGLANGDFWPSFTKLSIPLMKYQITKKEKHFRNFIKHFVHQDDEYMYRFQKTLLTGVRLDYRRPQILQAKDVKHFTNPVYLITADDDVFFPAPKVVAQAKKVFQNLVEIHSLKNCKHTPYGPHIREVEERIREWIG